MKSARPSFILAQPIPRSAFLFPRALYAAGTLAALVTGYVPPFGETLARILKCIPVAGLRRLSGLHPEGVPRNLVIHRGLIHLARHLILRWRMRGGGGGKAIMDFEADFSKWASRAALPHHAGFIGFSYSSLEIMQRERDAGRFCALIQIDAAELHQRIVLDEAKRWPNYAGSAVLFPQEYFDRARREWSLANLILVNSNWTRQMLIEEGVPETKIEVIPLAYRHLRGGVARHHEAGAVLEEIALDERARGRSRRLHPGRPSS